MDAGTVLGQRYLLEERLGAGGMGEVWAAHDERLRRGVAVKILLGARGGDGESIARLRREALAAAPLQHPGITVVHDIGEDDGHPYVVMERLAGETFADLTAKHPAGLPLELAAHLMALVADALDHAHAQGVVHRDIKPANLMRLASGGAKILDFGIASCAEATRLTSTGVVLGSAPYMPPEQWRGEQVTPAADMYSFGATLYALLAGQPPFPGPSFASWMCQHFDAAPPHLDGVPAELDALVQALLAKDPAARPSAAEGKDALSDILDRAGAPRTPGPTLRLPPPGDSPSRRPARPVEIRHTRQALMWRRAGRGARLSGLVLAAAGAPAGLALDHHLQQANYPGMALHLAGGALVAAVSGTLVTGTLRFLYGMSLTSDRVVLDGEAITVVEHDGGRSLRVRWDDLALIGLVEAPGRRRDLVVWPADDRAVRHLRLQRIERLDNEQGRAHRLYRTAAGLDRPQQLTAGQLGDVLAEHAGPRYHEVPRAPMANVVAVGDGSVLAVDRSGTLWRYTAPGSRGSRTVRAGSGWGGMTRLVATGNADGDILAVDGPGNLYRYHGPDYHGPGRTRVGTGWHTISLVTGTGDGTGDLFAVDGAGGLFHYRAPGYYGSRRRRIGTGWNVMTALVGIGDVRGSGSPDLLAVDASGTLFHYRGPHYYGSERRRVGSGWHTMTNLVAVPGAGTTDLLATEAATRTLYRYTGPAYSGTHRERIGGGW
ncbi:protein kinase [Streptomyces sp. NPDC048361]|uniref:protein kinase domain-containing protein n=1 Tax=Streptomyces sp. NPDC048361 TaxID=3154720 RepID=UPI003424DFBA